MDTLLGLRRKDSRSYLNTTNTVPPAWLHCASKLRSEFSLSLHSPPPAPLTITCGESGVTIADL